MRFVSCLAPVGRAGVSILVLLLSVTCGGGGSGSPTTPPPVADVIGSGVVSQQSVMLPRGFTTVDHSGVGSLFIEQGAVNHLFKIAEDNILAYLRAEVVGDVLRIFTQPGVSFQSNIPIEYRLTATSVRRIEMDGVGSIVCQRYDGDELSLVQTGVGSLSFTNLSVEDLDVRMSGVGELRATGSATRQKVVISGIDDYRANNLRSDEAEVEIQGMGSATVRVRNRLVARVQGSGCVYYIGSPVVEATITGSGCVQQIAG